MTQGIATGLTWLVIAGLVGPELGVIERSRAQGGGFQQLDQPGNGTSGQGTPGTGGGTNNGGQDGGQGGGNGNTGGGTGGGGGTSLSDFGLDNLDIGMDFVPTPNDRYRGFVGPTSESMLNNENGIVFVGPSSEVGEAGSYGGQQGTGTAGGGNGGGGFQNGGNLGFGTANETNFTVDRPLPIRTRLVPNFLSPARTDSLINSRFNRRISRMPVTRNFGANVQVSFEGQTAYLRGTVRNSQQADLLERQLRLEPGVYRIVNELRSTDGTLP
jgi:hypothetical protein